MTRPLLVTLAVAMTPLFPAVAAASHCCDASGPAASAPLASMAFMTGLLGSPHCIGMCGGLIAALAMAGGRLKTGIAFQLLYHGGRITTYAAIGAVVGRIGAALPVSGGLKGATGVLLIASDLFIILVGLGSAGLIPILRLIDLESGASFERLRGGVRRLMQLPPLVAAYPLGLLLGFLPCGFVYTMTITAAQSANPVGGALLMAAFGLGTLPALLAFGGAAHWLSHAARQRMLRAAGLVVTLMGLYNLYRHLHKLGVF